MELHSYAKTRSSRKWTTDQKRKLVENRITLDVLFNKKSFNLVDSWIKLIKVSDFDSFDIQFVRNQWINILLKYKNLVELHSNDSKIEIKEETRDLLTSEWEFFDKINRWIKYKERLNHNYINIISDEIDDESINQQLELFSTESSTEDDIITIKSRIGQQKILPNEQKQKINSTPNILLLNSQNSYPNLSLQQKQNIISKNTSTITNSSQNNNNNSGCSKSDENLLSKSRLNQHKKKINSTSKILLLNPQYNNNNSNLSSQQKQNLNSNNFQNNINSQESTSKSELNQLNQKNDETVNSLEHKSKKLHKIKSNKLKHYKNYRKYFNYKQSSRKIEKKINAFCQIFAQIVEKDYPDINITNLLNSSDDSTSSSD